MEMVRSSVPFEPAVLKPIEGHIISKRRILVYDCESEARVVVSQCLAEDDFDLVYCQDITELTTQLLKNRSESGTGFELLLWGLHAPYDEGLRTLRELREIYTDLKVVLLAPQEALAFAPAIKVAGVEAFILSPHHPHDFRAGFDRALRAAGRYSSPAARLVDRAGESSPATARVDDGDPGRSLGLIGSSPEIRKVISLIHKVGPSTCNVLVTGESGSGKEMVAQAIHRVSDRAKKPFVAINCAAIPRELLESELFGHAKGAFTGATNARRGIFEEAHEGTILLDEIGDLPLPLQAKILRLLQTRQVKPLGQNSVKEVDVRIISATHKNLKQLIQKGEFREDLYYRLNVMPMHLPPLRERKEDIIELAEFFLQRYANRTRTPMLALTKKAQAKLLNLPWKGNVRELENVIERAIVLASDRQITENEILTEEMEPVRATTEDLFNAGMSLKDIEREYIKYVLSRTGNRKEAATRILGIDRKTLYRKEKVYGIRPPGEMN